MLGIMFKSALGLDAVYGGLFGSAIAWGIRRGVYSTEAGMGSGAQAAASSEVSHPVKQGLAQAFSVYNTAIICVCTALMIMATGAFNVVDGSGNFITEGVPGIQAGIGYTQAAIDTLFPGHNIGATFIAVAIFFFAFTTLMSFGFYVVVNISFWLRGSALLKPVVILFGCMQIASIIYGSVHSSDLAWGIADVGVGLLVWSNLIGMAFLGGTCAKVMRDYDRQVAKGLDPVFRPAEAGINNAELWNTIVEKNYKHRNSGKS
jgi:AGCS family alanine or glycine:cation symporter